jgi:MFS family permease
MRTPALWMFATATGMVFLVQAGVNTHLAAYLRDEGLTAAFAGFGISLNAAFLGLGSIFWGWITEKFPARYVLASVAISVGGASALFIIADSTVEILVYAVLFGFGVGGLLSVPPVGYADYYGRRSLGAIRGVTEPLTTFGQAIGAVAAGLIYDLTESYQLAFMAFAVMGGLAMVLVLFAVMGGLAMVLVLFARPPRRPLSTETALDSG